MQRRVFVKLSAFTAAAITLPLVSGCRKGAPDAESQPLFFSHLVDVQTISAVGKACLSRWKDEDDPDKVKARLLEGIDSRSGVKPVRAGLVRKIQDDFRNNRTIIAKGWILSETEARQCMLFYLLNA